MDQAIALWSFGFERIAWLDQIMQFVTNLGEKGFLWIALSVVLTIYKPTRKAGIACMLALALFSLVGLAIIKPIVMRPRPFEELAIPMMIPHPGGSSFPSGHAGTAVATAMALFLFYRNWFGKLILIIAGLIAFTRLFFIVHYFTDVLVGILLGIVCAYVAKYVIGKVMK